MDNYYIISSKGPWRVLLAFDKSTCSWIAHDVQFSKQWELTYLKTKQGGNWYLYSTHLGWNRLNEAFAKYNDIAPPTGKGWLNFCSISRSDSIMANMTEYLTTELLVSRAQFHPKINQKYMRMRPVIDPLKQRGSIAIFDSCGSERGNSECILIVSFQPKIASVNHFPDLDRGWDRISHRERINTNNTVSSTSTSSQVYNINTQAEESEEEEEFLEGDIGIESVIDARRIPQFLSRNNSILNENNETLDDCSEPEVISVLDFLPAECIWWDKVDERPYGIDDEEEQRQRVGRHQELYEQKFDQMVAYLSNRPFNQRPDSPRRAIFTSFTRTIGNGNTSISAGMVGREIRFDDDREGDDERLYRPREWTSIPNVLQSIYTKHTFSSNVVTIYTCSTAIVPLGTRLLPLQQQCALLLKKGDEQRREKGKRRVLWQSVLNSIISTMAEFMGSYVSNAFASASDSVDVDKDEKKGVESEFNIMNIDMHVDHSSSSNRSAGAVLYCSDQMLESESDSSAADEKHHGILKKNADSEDDDNFIAKEYDDDEGVADVWDVNDCEKRLKLMRKERKLKRRLEKDDAKEHVQIQRRGYNDIQAELEDEEDENALINSDSDDAEQKSKGENKLKKPKAKRLRLRLRDR